MRQSNIRNREITHELHACGFSYFLFITFGRFWILGYNDC
jgi:hypothetical protein